MSQVGPIAGSIVNPEFGDALADRLSVAEVSKFEPCEASRDLGCRPAIPQLLKPIFLRGFAS